MPFDTLSSERTLAEEEEEARRSQRADTDYRPRSPTNSPSINATTTPRLQRSNPTAILSFNSPSRAKVSASRYYRSRIAIRGFYKDLQRGATAAPRFIRHCTPFFEFNASTRHLDVYFAILTLNSPSRVKIDALRCCYSQTAIREFYRDLWHQSCLTLKSLLRI